MVARRSLIAVIAASLAVFGLCFAAGKAADGDGEPARSTDLAPKLRLPSAPVIERLPAAPTVPRNLAAAPKTATVSPDSPSGTGGHSQGRTPPPTPPPATGPKPPDPEVPGPQ